MCSATNVQEPDIRHIIVPAVVVLNRTTTVDIADDVLELSVAVTVVEIEQ